MVASGEIHVESTDMGCLDHFLVWMELGRVAKCGKREKRIIRKWWLDRFDDEEVKRRYHNALKSEVSGFVECVSRKEHSGITGMELVGEVLMEWERRVNRVAKVEVGEKMIVCGSKISKKHHTTSDTIYINTIIILSVIIRATIFHMQC